VTGIPEEISETFLVSINEETNFEPHQDSEDRKKHRSRKSTVNFKKFVREISTQNC
jgi:hypothetical protein